MRTRLPTAAAVVMVGALLLACSGCSATAKARAERTTSATAQAAVHDASTPGVVSRALENCGLSATTPGVTLGPTGDLALISQPKGQPTDVVVATTGCVLDHLGLSAKDAELFQTTAATGGYQTLEWNHFSATLKFRDTLDFDVTVFAAR